MTQSRLEVVSETNLRPARVLDRGGEQRGLEGRVLGEVVLKNDAVTGLAGLEMG